MTIKGIPGFPGYACDAEGSVYSSFRQMRSAKTSRGYLKVQLYRDRKAFTCLVHRLVASAWIGPGDGLEVNHKNGIKTDNRVANLEWTTRTQNERHARTALGKDCRGERHKCAKVNEEQVRELRALRKEGWTYARLAARYSIGISQACRITKSQKWSHVV